MEKISIDRNYTYSFGNSIRLAEKGFDNLGGAGNPTGCGRYRNCPVPQKNKLGRIRILHQKQVQLGLP